MPSIKGLLEHVYDHTGLLPTWPLDERLDVGDVIIRTRAGIRRETSLRTLLPDEVFAVREESLDESTFAVSRGVGVESEAAASAAGLARIRLRFTEDAGYAFVVQGGLVRCFEDPLTVKQAMLRLRRAARWPDGGELVTWVRTADSSCLVVGHNSGAVAVGAVRLGLAAQMLPVDVHALDASSTLTWTGRTGVQHRAVSSTALHQAFGFRRLRSEPVDASRPIRSGGDGPADDEVVDVVRPSDLPDLDLPDLELP